MADAEREVAAAAAADDDDVAPLTAESLAAMPWPAVQQMGKALKVIRVGMKRADVEAAILGASAAGPGTLAGSGPDAPAVTAAPGASPCVCVRLARVGVGVDGRALA